MVPWPSKRPSSDLPHYIFFEGTKIDVGDMDERLGFEV